MKFLHGIYGIDLLSLVLLLVASLFNISRYTNFIGFALVIISLLRIFSRNIAKRQAENNSLITFLNKPLSKLGVRIPYNSQPIDFTSFSYSFRIIKSKLNEMKNYKITKCPQCGQKLRLPRKKGKIVVTCKRCLHKFDFRT
ncbi:hypothetical protein R0131_02225 [Clostridium sp. AL.422]|uniref:hypothetical protein n=1 Tax=Clostridium TaxID=1485 RepID=UPI00293DDE0D|nr:MULTISPECIES: hypothetical protein [unclassified Clostridium]MDV4149642.1 hypothetical protein [Clostridium sp. AL.422]